MYFFWIFGFLEVNMMHDYIYNLYHGYFIIRHNTPYVTQRKDLQESTLRYLSTKTEYTKE